MATHVAATTQQRYPWRAAARTGLQVVLSLAIVVPLALAALNETLGDLLPEPVRAKIGVIGGGIVAVSLFLARIMAIPQVDRFLRAIGLSSSPQPAIGPEQGGGL